MRACLVHVWGAGTCTPTEGLMDRLDAVMGGRYVSRHSRHHRHRHRHTVRTTQRHDRSAIDAETFDLGGLNEQQVSTHTHAYTNGRLNIYKVQGWAS